MLSLGRAHKWPLHSLTRICENGKWKICPRALKALRALRTLVDPVGPVGGQRLAVSGQQLAVSGQRSAISN